MRLTEDEIVASLPPWYTQVSRCGACGRCRRRCSVLKLPACGWRVLRLKQKGVPLAAGKVQQQPAE